MTALSEASVAPPLAERAHRSLIDLIAPTAVGMIALAIFVFNGTSGFTAYPTQLGDGVYNNTILEHFYLWVVGKEPDFWSPPYFFPWDGVLAFGDTFIGNGFVYAAGRLAGLGRETAYSVWFFVGFATSYIGAYIALRLLKFSPLASAVGALIFAFAGPIIIKTAHSQLIYRFASPLAFAFCWRFLTEGRLRHMALAGIFIAWQFLCSFYLGVFLVIFLGIALVIATFLARTRQQLIRLPSRALAQAAPVDYALLGLFALVGAFCAYAMITQFAIMSSFGLLSRTPEFTISLLPEPAAFLNADHSRLYSGMAAASDIPNRGEKEMFTGFVALILAVVFLFSSKRRRPWRDVTVLCLLAFVGLCLLVVKFGQDVTLYWPIAMTPGLSAIRAPGRIIEIMLLPLAVAAAAGFSALPLVATRAKAAAKAAGSLGRVAVFAVVAGLLLVEQAYVRIDVTPISTLAERKARLQAMIPPNLPKDAVLALHLPENGEWFSLSEVDAMIMAQDNGVTTINGFSGNFPPGFKKLEQCGDIDERLVGYTSHMKISGAEAQALFDRIIPLGFDADCTYGDGREFAYANPEFRTSETPLTTDYLSRLSLSISDITATPDNLLSARIVVQNGNTSDLNPNPGAAKAVKFSWRFAPADGPVPAGLGWDPRATLTRTVPAGESRAQTIRIPPPPGPGEFLLQVSMVQEGVIWFHDAGVQPATGAIRIIVGQAGNLQLVAAPAQAPPPGQ